MSDGNPFKTAKQDEQKSTKTAKDASQSGQKETGSEQVSELKDELRELRGEVKELRGVMEPEPPEPDFECAGGECDGFAVGEVEPEHVTTHSSMFKSSTRPKTVECPRCNEEMPSDALVPKEEQQTSFGGKPLKSNAKAAGRTLEQRFKEEGREDVLESAGKQ